MLDGSSMVSPKTTLTFSQTPALTLILKFHTPSLSGTSGELLGSRNVSVSFVPDDYLASSFSISHPDSARAYLCRDDVGSTLGPETEQLLDYGAG